MWRCSAGGGLAVHFAKDALEVVLGLSTLAYAALFVYACIVRDGRIWTVLRWNVGASAASSLLATLAVHQIESLSLAPLSIIWLMVACRFVGAVTAMVIALDLRRRSLGGG